MNHLETLVAEYLDWQGFLVRRNTKVGKLAHGGWAMELDIVGYNPHTGTIVHYEPSTDAHTWAKREERFGAKFACGREYIFTELFTWLSEDIEIEQIAICPSHPKGRDTLGGGRLVSIDEFIHEVRTAVAAKGPLRQHAISETYPLLRTIQLMMCGYNSVFTPAR